MLGFALFLSALVADGLRRGVIDANMPLDREEYPGTFAFLIMFYAACALVIIGLVLFA